MGHLLHRNRTCFALCLLGVLPLAAPSVAAEDVQGAVVLVELRTREAATVSVTYRQVRALATEDDARHGLDILSLKEGGSDIQSALLPLQHVAADTHLTVAVPVPLDLPAWRGVPDRLDEILFGDCVVIAVDDRTSVVVVNDMPTDEETVGNTSPRRMDVSSELVGAFKRACPAEATAERRYAPLPVGGIRMNVGSGVTARVSKRKLDSLLVPDEAPRSPFSPPPANNPDLGEDGRWFVVGPVEDATPMRTTEACHETLPSGKDRRRVLVCSSRSMVRVSDGFAWLDPEGKAAGATRSSDAPFASLTLTRFGWKPLILPRDLGLADVGFWKSLILPRDLGLADVGFCYGQDGTGGNGCLELVARRSSDGVGVDIRLPEAWADSIQVAVRNERLKPFDLKIRPKDPTGPGELELELTYSGPALKCLVDAAANDVACDAIERADGLHNYLREWAIGGRECGAVEPGYAARSSICARLSEDGGAIEVEASSVQWLRFGLRVSTEETAGSVPAAFWELQVADDGRDADSADSAGGLRLDRRGTVEAHRLASLLGAREEARIVARAPGSGFIGYGPVTVGVSKEELRRPGADGSLFATRRVEESAPLEIALTPDLTKRFAPLLEIETRDGEVVRAIGPVDRFGANPNRVEDGRRGGGGTIRASSIQTVRARGLRYRGELPMDRSKLRPVIDALREPDELRRCMALLAAFEPSPRGVDLYAPGGQVALRWRDDDGRSRVSVPASSDMSSAFSSAPDVTREGLQIWGARGWRDFEDRDACAPPPPPASRTLRILLLAEDLNRVPRGRRPTAESAAATIWGRDDVTAFRALWSRHADDLRDVLRAKGFTRVDLTVVDADEQGRPSLESMAAIDSLDATGDDKAFEFRRLHEPLHAMSGTGETYRLDDRNPLAVRRAFLESASEDLDPFATLLLLVYPHGEERMDEVFDGAVAKLRVVSGYLGPDARFVDLVVAAVSPGGGASR